MGSVAEGAELPTEQLMPNEVPAPTEPNPIKFETLNLKFGSEDLAPIT